MAKVIGTHGKPVDFQVRGVETTLLKLRLAGEEVKDGADLGVVQAGTFIEEEVKESIAGNRVEHKSVDTGKLIKSIEFKKTGEAEGVVKPKRESYPNSDTTTIEVATIIEFSPNIIGGPRSHFRNTEKRNINEVKKKIERAIKIALL